MPGAFELMGSEFEQVVYNHDRASGLRAIIAIHSTALGPSLGGTRFYPYATEDDALRDVLRLARGMTYKSAAAGLDVGGGKGVIIGDPRRDKTEPLLRAYGRFVESLGGRYITAEDVGTFTDDMEIIARETSYVTGRAEAFGGGGDPSLTTAFGVFRGMQAVAEQLWASDKLSGRHVVVLGVGKVGYELCRLLREAGARLTISDVDAENLARAVEDFDADAVESPKAHATPCDILAPCALGGVVNDDTLPELRCAAIAGAANNVLERDENDQGLKDAGILYAPDYVINAGGIISVADELDGHLPARVRARTEQIFDTLSTVFRRAEDDQVPTGAAADRLAEARISEVSRLQLVRVQPQIAPARSGGPSR